MNIFFIYIYIYHISLYIVHIWYIHLEPFDDLSVDDRKFRVSGAVTVDLPFCSQCVLSSLSNHYLAHLRLALFP